MSAAALAFSAIVAAGTAPPPAADGDHTPVHCRPAPYYVADRSGLPPRLALQDNDRKARACYLVTQKKKPLHILL